MKKFESRFHAKNCANLVLVKGALKRGGYWREHYWKALKHVLPLMLYPTAYFLTYMVKMILLAIYVSQRISYLIVASLLLACSFVLLVSLLLQEKFVSNCRLIFSSRCSRYGGLQSALAESIDTTSIRNLNNAESDGLIDSARYH